VTAFILLNLFRTSKKKLVKPINSALKTTKLLKYAVSYKCPLSK